MDKLLKLNLRQQHILRATVRHYVSTAEPVGSKALVNAYDLKVSAATIRNVMGVLERSGLLYQPHTSAGRIPSDSGYRTYVDDLIQPSKPVARRVNEVLNDRLDWEGWSIEALLREVAQVLADISGYIALVTLPTAEAARLKHLQLVQVEAEKILLVVLLDCHTTESILIPLPKVNREVVISSDALDRQLQILSNFLTTQLRDKPLSAVSGLSLDELDAAFQQYASTLAQAIADLAKRTRRPQTQILVSGLADALSQPEFSELNQVQNLVSLLADGPEILWPLIFKGDETHPLQVWIGSENPLAPMQTFALISARYTRDAIPLGSVGVLGPTRMFYENAIAAVESAASYLSGAITQTV